MVKGTYQQKLKLVTEQILKLVDVFEAPYTNYYYSLYAYANLQCIYVDVGTVPFSPPLPTPPSAFPYWIFE
jgi:hypothetical protein